MNKYMARSKKMLRNIILAFTVKGGAVIVGVLTVQAYMKFFSNEIVLGVWYTLLSLLTWVLNFDLGIGNGLRNLLVVPLTEKDTKRVKILVSSGYIVVGVVSVCILLVGIMCIYSFDLNSLMNIDSSIISPPVLRKSFIIVLCGIIGQFFLKMITSILNAQEKTAVSSMLPLVSNIIVLVFVATFAQGGDEERLLTVSWVYIAAINIPYVLTSIIIFSRSLRESIPNIRCFQREIAQKILSLGGGFFAIQIALLVITVTNEFVITRLYGADKVVEYQVYNKVFYTVVTLFSLITNPVWSSITVAYCERRISWIDKTYKYMLGLAGLASIFAIALALMLQPIVDLWLRDQAMRIDLHKSMAFVLYSVVLMFCYAESSIANGMSKLKHQMRCYIFAACVKFPLCYLFYRTLSGWETIVLANGLALLPYVFIQHFAIKNDISKELDKTTQE